MAQQELQLGHQRVILFPACDILAKSPKDEPYSHCTPDSHL